MGTSRTKGRLTRVPSSLNVDDVLWAYQHLDYVNVAREAAPSVGAWAMLQWAREARGKFFSQMLVKALKMQVAANLAAAVETGQPAHQLEDVKGVQEPWNDRDLLSIVPAALVSEVESTVVAVLRQRMPDLQKPWTPQIQDLIDRCTIVVGKCWRVAYELPELFHRESPTNGPGKSLEEQSDG